MANASELSESIDRINAALERGAHEEARRLITAILDEDPTQRDGLLCHAVLEVQEGNGRAALEVLDQALDHHPDDISLLMLRAAVLMDFYDDHAEARLLLEDVLDGLRGWLPANDDEVAAQKHAKAETLRLLSRCHLDAGNAEEGLEAAEEALRMAPHDAAVLLAVAEANYEAGNLDEARDLAGRSMEQAPTADADWLLGRVHSALGDHAAADELLHRAAEKEPARFHHPTRTTEAAFQQALAQAMEALPSALREYLKRARIRVAETPSGQPRPSARRIGPGALSSCPTPLPDLSEARDLFAVAPEEIVLYRRNLEIAAATPEALVELMATCLTHEVARFVGLDAAGFEEPQPPGDAES
ncbi:MAG: tetratricopeptide repeat protein [Myxococcota bacterium]